MPKLMRLGKGLGLVDAIAMECHPRAGNCKQLLASMGGVLALAYRC
jgi:hypothetical protein